MRKSLDSHFSTLVLGQIKDGRLSQKESDMFRDPRSDFAVFGVYFCLFVWTESIADGLHRSEVEVTI